MRKKNVALQTLSYRCALVVACLAVAMLVVPLTHAQLDPFSTRRGLVSRGGAMEPMRGRHKGAT